MNYQATSTITTEKASRYLQQMCKHFAHKVDVDFTKEEGTVNLPFGDLKMVATETALSLHISASDEETITRMEEATAKHLERFMFREQPEITWQRDFP